MAKTMVFIDSRVNNLDLFISRLSTETEYRVLDSTHDGLLQIEESLAGKSNYDTIQIISQSSCASLSIGSTILDENNLFQYQMSLETIGRTLIENGKLLLSGCNIGADVTGQQFIQSLSQLTGADVVVLNDLMGVTAASCATKLEGITGSTATTGLHVASNFTSAQTSVLSSIGFGTNDFGGESAIINKMSSFTLQLLENVDQNKMVAVNNFNSKSVALNAGTEILVDIIVDSTFSIDHLKDLEALGLINAAKSHNLVSGSVAISDIRNLLNSHDVLALSYSPYSSHVGSGSVASGAEQALGSDTVNNQGYTGAGISIGVLSDSFDNLGGASTDLRTGDLSTVNVLDDLENDGSDEGRAMLQIVHDIAPGSSLSFATAFTGFAEFANNIIALADNGAKVIVDDVSYFAQLTFTDDVIRQAIDTVTQDGHIYLTSNGNGDAQGIIEKDCVFTDYGGIVFGQYFNNILDFAPATSDGLINFLVFQATTSGQVILRMTWSSPAPSVHGGMASSDLDFYILDWDSRTFIGSGTTDQTTASNDPIELCLVNVTAGKNYSIVIERYSGDTPQYVQVNSVAGANIDFGNNIDFRYLSEPIDPDVVNEFSNVYGNGLSAGAISVGAVDYLNSPATGGNGDVEYFSSYGQGYLTYDTNGNKLATPEVRIGAEVAGVDGLNNTFFGQTEFFRDGDLYPNFFGTSAAAPSVAAVVALLLQKDPSLTRDEILHILQSTAINAISYLNESAFDPVSGAGLINAEAAIALIGANTGTEGNDTITGSEGNNTLFGLGGNDTIYGLGGNDLLDGGSGDDSMRGGKGDDKYVVDSTGDVVIENVNKGIDTVQSSITYTLGANIENLTLTGTANINGTGNILANILVGNGGNNLLSGELGNDTMLGGAGNDTCVVDSTGDIVTENFDEGTDMVQSSIAYALGANVENLTLTGTAAITGTGNALANTIIGNSGNNTLDGGAGNDTLQGGAGNDTYMVDSVGDVVMEASVVGTDMVQSSVTYTLYDNVENLTLTDTADINGSGNTLANILVGNSGDNILDGGADNDTMQGGFGNDTYIVDSVGDVVTEAASAGTETVQSSVTYTLGANVENLTLTGIAAINGTGNALDNLLIGNSGQNSLKGGAGNDTLDGGAGNDTMQGGAGKDTYIVDSVSDVVTEAASAGTDTVQSSVTYMLGANVENLTMTGIAAINGTGNTLENIIVGNSSNNLLRGVAGDDTIQGWAGNDTLDGGSGKDSINGGAGSDLYVVALASDHAVAEFGDTGSGAGEIDEVRFTSTTAGTLKLYTGDTGIEIVVLGTGTAASAVTTGTTALNVNASAVVNSLSITGNAGANSLTGTAYADTLDGGAGNDVLISGKGDDTLIGGTGNDSLTGGAGSDHFVFATAPDATFNKDTLTDFVSGIDELQFSKAIFAALGAVGELSGAEFLSGAGLVAAQDSSDRIIYNTTTGALYYDADGFEGAAAVQVAIIGTSTHPTMVSADILVIA